MLSVLSILGVPSSDVPTGHTPAPFSGGPIRPVGCGNKALPKPILANCTDALAAGVPDLRGNWQSSAFRGTHHWERIEQCGDRIVWTSGCVVHDFRHMDGTTTSGCHDYSAVACVPLRVAATFNATCVVLRPFNAFNAVTRCVNANGTMFLDWAGSKTIMSRTNRSYGFQACDQPAASAPAVVDAAPAAVDKTHHGCQGGCQGCGQCCQNGVAMPTTQCFDDPSASFCCPDGCDTPTCKSGQSAGMGAAGTV